MDHDSPRIISEEISAPSDPGMQGKFKAFNRMIQKNSRNRYAPVFGLFGLLALSAIAIGSAQFVSQRKSFENSSAAGSEILVEQKVESALARSSKIRVIVKLNSQFTPEGELDVSRKTTQRSDIKRLQKLIEDEVKAGNATVIHKYETIPLMNIEIDRALLEKLKKMKGVVVSVHENPITFPQLYESAPTVRAPEAWAAGYTGSGQVVAVVDSGVDSTHPFLQGQIIDGVCTRDCPNGTHFQVGIEAAVPCPWILPAPGCTHGTQISGIIAGKDTLADGKQIAGIAKGAKILAARAVQKVCTDPNNEATCRLGVDGGDLVAALDWIYQQKDRFPIAAVSLSTGSGPRSETCVDDPLYTNIINNFRSAGIAVVTASGNDALISQIATISCADNVVVVGSSAGIPGTPLGEFIPNYSNSSTKVANFVLAPGDLKKTSIISINGPTYSGAFGTSFAAPHVAAAMAVFRSAVPAATVPTMISAIKSTGVQVTDTRANANSVKYPRLDVTAAVNLLKSGGSASVGPTSSCTATTGTSTTCNMSATLGASTENEEVLGVETSNSEPSEAQIGEVLQATTQATTYGKMMIATVAYIGDPSIPELQATSMTYCGATMSRLGGATGIANYSGQHLEMWYLLNPSGAACPLKANFTRSRTDLTPADPRDRILTRTVFENVPNINFISGIVRIAGYNSPGSTFLDLRDSGPAKSRFVCSYSNYPNGVQNVVTPSGTQWKQIWSGKATLNIQSAIGVSDPRTTAGQIMNIKWNGTQSQPWAGICINLMQGATAGATNPTPTPIPPTTVTLKINGSDGPVKAKPGDLLTLSWFPVSANTCTASGGAWTGGKSITPVTDSQTALPGVTTYTITCTGTRTVSDSVVVQTAPKVELRVNGSTTEATVDKGIAPTLNWSVVGATSCTASGGWTGTKAIAGGSEKPTIPTTATTYTLTCTGAGGTTAQTVTAKVSAVTAPLGYYMEYFRDTNFSSPIGTKTMSSINFDWGTTGVPFPGLSTNYYSARFTAQITPSVTGTYTFITTSDDGTRMYIDDKLVIYDWIYHGRSIKTGTMALTAGKQYNLVIEYVETTGGATMIFQAGIGTNPAALNPKATKLPLGTNGGGLTAYFYTDSKYTTFGTTEHTPVLDSLMVMAPDTTMPYNFKSVRYGGYLVPTVTSTYSFQYPAEANFYINGVKKTASGGVTTHAMTANVSYPITLEMPLSSFAYAHLKWKYGTLPYTPVDFRIARPN